MNAALVFAATLTFAFDGLLMFQGGDQGMQNVLVVNAPLHGHSHICLWHAEPPEEMKEVARIELKPGDTVDLDLPPGRVIPSAMYREHVPELKRFIRRGRIEPNPTPDAVITSIALPQGTLVPWRTFEEKVGLVQVNNEFVKYCLSRFVVLQTPIQGEVKVVVKRQDHPDQSFTARHGDLIFVSNVSQDTEHLHFPFYARLLTANGRLGGVDVLDHDYCDTELNVGTLDPLIEDALNAHRPTPNGDCGQVRNQGGGG